MSGIVKMVNREMWMSLIYKLTFCGQPISGIYISVKKKKHSFIIQKFQSLNDIIQKVST